MKKFIRVIAVASVVAAAVIGATTSSASAKSALPPDTGWAGGGYLLDSTGINAEAHRQRFEFAFRWSQADGSSRGKPLVMRLPAPDGSRYVLRSWPDSTYPQYNGTPGWPADPHDGATIGRCAGGPDGFGQGMLFGVADVYLDLGGGVELRVGQFPYLLSVRTSAPFGPALRLIPLTPTSFSEVIGDLTSGSIGGSAGPFAPSC